MNSADPGAPGRAKPEISIVFRAKARRTKAVRREPSGVCSSHFRGQTDAGQLALLRFNGKVIAIGLALPLKVNRKEFMDFMLSFRPLMLAQANAAAEQASGGELVSMLEVLLTMATSLAMIVVWVARIGQTGHALPAAQRGILRVPVPLTLVAIGLSLMMIALTILFSGHRTSSVTAGPGNDGASGQQGSEEAAQKGSDGQGEKGTKAAGADSASEVPAATAEETPNSADPQNPELVKTAPDAPITVPDTAPPTPESRIPNPQSSPSMTPAQMRRALVDTVIMDLFLFAVLGIIVLVSRRFGRVRLSESGRVIPFPVIESSLLASTTYSSSTFWPDLDDTSAIPQLPGYAILGERTVPQPVAGVRQDLPSAPLTDAGLTDPNSPYAPPGIAESTLHQEPLLPDERFSFLTELRYAGETFLAAYVPTTFLRVLVVLITKSIFGEDPGQHPFLDMLDSGVDFSVMALIVLTAVIMAPVVEELQFRVVMLGGLAQLGRPMLALGLSSFLFAFAHGFPDSLALLPLAVALGYTYLRRRSYVTVMLVHFLFNGFNMAIALIAMA